MPPLERVLVEELPVLLLLAVVTLLNFDECNFCHSSCFLSWEGRLHWQMFLLTFQSMLDTETLNPYTPFGMRIRITILSALLWVWLMPEE